MSGVISKTCACCTGFCDGVLVVGIENTISTLSQIVNIIDKIIHSEQTKNSIKVVSEFCNYVSQVFSSDYMQSVKDSFIGFGNAVIEANDNPNSTLNYYRYLKQLKAFHWAWPFNISTNELKILVEQANNEKEFDSIISSFFSENIIQEMLLYIRNNIPRKHKVMFKQIVEAYNNKHYALINNAVFPIIENILGILVDDKRCVSRRGLLHPIIKFYSDNYCLSDIYFIFPLQMLSNNIDLIFEKSDFKKVTINTNKKVYRHLSAHGYMCSNNRVDTIMLLNTLAALLINMPYIAPFRYAIIRNSDKNKKNRKQENKKLENLEQKFYIEKRPYVIKNRIYKELKIAVDSSEG